MNILFVDDDERVLKGIENSMLFAPVTWRPRFATSVSKAIDILEHVECDMVVTDMMMPEENGLDMLRYVRAYHPEAVRIILSGEVEQDLAAAAMAIADEFLSKPCDPEELMRVIEKLYRSSRALADVASPELIEALDRLPPVPAAYSAIQEALLSGEGIDRIAELVGADIASSALIMKLANSAFYGFKRPATSLQDAVGRLGGRSILGIVLSAEIGNWGSPEVIPMVEQINLHSAQVSRIAMRLSPGQSSLAGLAGLLHDVGLLVVLAAFPERAHEFIAAHGKSEEELARLESEVTAVGHAEIGAHVMELWGMGPQVVEIVRHHHGSGHLLSADGSALEAVMAADWALEAGEEARPHLDPDLVKRAMALVAPENVDG